VYTRILVPLDGSKLSECALAHVKNIVQGSPETEVVLISVHEEIVPLDSYPPSETRIKEMVRQREQTEKEIGQRLEDYLTETAGALAMGGITVKKVVIHPEPLKGAAEAIIDYARDNQVDLIIMSTHGRTGVSRWAFGSVADKVAHYSKVAVLIVPPAQCRV
jgi:nucleotide-binding universal stress UspA family protein